MHNSALESFNNFKNVYLSKLSNKKFKLIEIGSLSVNSNIKNSLEDNMEYIGIDIVKGENVDVVLDDPYKFPFEDKSVDVVISISNFLYGNITLSLFHQTGPTASAKNPLTFSGNMGAIATGLSTVSM